MNIDIDRVSEGQFVRMRGEWNSLLEKSVTNEIFLLWEWMYSWWDIFKNESKELYLLRGKNAMGETIGIAPFYLQKKTLFGNIKRNMIRFCSSVETYPDHLDVIARKEYEHLFAEAVFDYLAQHGHDWDLIKLEGVHENAVIKHYLTSVRPEVGKLLIEVVPDARCPYLPMDHTFEDYLKSFSPKKRQTLLRKRKILMNREEALLKTVDPDEEPEKHIQELFALHGERAKRKGIRSTFWGEDLRRFHSKTTHYLSKEGKVLLTLLHKEATPLASYYCFKHNRKYYYYQAGLSDEGEKRSAGTVLFSLILEKAFGERCEEFDFLRGSEEYKFFWTKSYRQDYSITVRKDDLVNKMVHYGYAVYRRTRNLFRGIDKPERIKIEAVRGSAESVKKAGSRQTALPPRESSLRRGSQ